MHPKLEQVELGVDEDDIIDLGASTADVIAATCVVIVVAGGGGQATEIKLDILSFLYEEQEHYGDKKAQG